jgi:hypothetical protein
MFDLSAVALAKVDVLSNSFHSFNSLIKKLLVRLFPSGRRKTRETLKHFFDRIDRILKIQIQISNPIKKLSLRLIT